MIVLWRGSCPSPTTGFSAKKMLDDSSDIELVKLASFFLNYHKDEMDYATEQDAMKLVDEWKSKTSTEDFT